MPRTVARRPMVRPSSPSTEARSAAACRIDSRVALPRRRRPSASSSVPAGSVEASVSRFSAAIPRPKVARPFDDVIQSTTDRAFFYDEGRTMTAIAIPQRRQNVLAVAAGAAFLALLDTTVANLAVADVRTDFA